MRVCGCRCHVGDSLLRWRWHSFYRHSWEGDKGGVPWSTAAEMSMDSVRDSRDKSGCRKDTAQRTASLLLQELVGCPTVDVLSLVQKSLPVAHRFCLSVAHNLCATKLPSVVSLICGAQSGRHRYATGKRGMASSATGLPVAHRPVRHR